MGLALRESEKRRGGGGATGTRAVTLPVSLLDLPALNLHREWTRW